MSLLCRVTLLPLVTDGLNRISAKGWHCIYKGRKISRMEYIYSMQVNHLLFYEASPNRRYLYGEWYEVAKG